MRAALSLLPALLLLGACSGDEREPANAANSTQVDIETLPPDESASTPTNALATGVTEPVVLPDSAIPVFFHGRWGQTAADCATDEPGRGHFTISATAIRFADSMAVPSRLTELSPKRITGEFRFVGERGRRWTAPMAFAVEERRLVRVDGASGSRLLYFRC